MRLTDDTPAGVAGVLVDDSGRRARLLRRAGRAVSVLLLLWLGVLALGALGLEPLGGGVPGLGSGAKRIAAPPKLPARVQEGADAAPRVVPAARPRAAAAVPARPAARTTTNRRAVTGARRKRAAAIRPTLPSAGPKPTGTAVSQPPSQSLPANASTTPSRRTGTTPSGNTVGGKSATAPGQTKTTPQPQGNGNGRQPTATTP